MAIDSAPKRRSMLSYATEFFGLVEHTVDSQTPQSARYARLGLLGNFGDSTVPQNFAAPFISLRAKLRDELEVMAKFASTFISRSVK